MKILIPNATGPTNIGDQAILIPMIDLLKKNYPEASITIHTTTPHLYSKTNVKNIDSHLYNWAIFENKNPCVRIKRLFELCIAYASLRLRIPLIARGKLKKLLKDYLSADLIVFIGGGYFRSKKRFSQSLNLCMISSSFHFAKLTNAAKVVLPLSFGPFAHSWQERFSADALRGFNIVAARESFSYQALRRCKVPNTILSSDTALLLNVKTEHKRTRDFVVGYTIRTWFDKQQQHVFEQNFIDSLHRFTEKTNSIVQPIVQVVGEKYGESDHDATERIATGCRDKNIVVLKTRNILTMKDAQVYSEIDLLVGMRMHSNILAAVYKTPFVAISYEHKTEGIAQDLGMGEYVIKCEAVTSQNLYELLTKAYENRMQLKETIDTFLEKIRLRETKRWDNIFQIVC